MPFSYMRDEVVAFLNPRKRYGFWSAVTVIAVAWIVHSHTFAWLYTPDMSFIWYGSEGSLQKSFETVSQTVNRKHKTDSRISELSNRRLEESFAQLQTNANQIAMVEVEQ